MHTRRVRASAQSTAPAEHTGVPGPPVLHVCAAEQVPVLQSRSSRHSTHAPEEGSQNCPRAAHAFEAGSHRPALVERTHVWSVHCCPLGQSTVFTQSTHALSAGSHTCPGHMRELEHGVGTTQ